MVVYADTSFLFSLYAQDANTAQAGEVASGLRAPLAFTPWHRHELRNAFRLALFRGEMTAQQCETLLATTEADLRAGALAETALAWGDVFGEAEALSAAKVAKLGTRAADVLHVAAAVTLGSREFYTFDARQQALAKAAGLKVKP